MLKLIQRFSAPQFAEHEKARKARATHYLILTSGVVMLLPLINNILLLRWAPVWTMIAEELWMGVAFTLNRKGAVKLAVHVLAASLLVATTVIIWTGREGIHAPAVLAYPAILILVSFLLNNRALAAYTIAAILCVGASVAAEMNGILNSTMGHYTSVRSFISITSILIVTAVSLGFLTGDLRRTQHKMLEHAANLKKSDEVLQSIVEGTVYSVGEEYARTLVAHIARAFDVKYVFVGCLTAKHDHIRTIAVWANNNLAPNFEYSLARTPCANVISQSICVYPTNVQNLFPEDVLLAQMGVESYCGTPIFGHNGRPLGILVVLDDKPMKEPDERVRAILKIFAARAGAELERMKSDEAVLKSEEKFSTAFHNSPVVISLCHARDMRYIEVNETFFRVTGYSPEEVIGKTILEVGLLAYPERLKDFVQKLRAERKVRDYEFDARMKNGSIRRGLLSATLIEIGGEECVLSVNEDITERRAAEQVLQRAHDELERRVQERTAELEAANKELEAFSYSVSHDLQSPLRSINSFTQYVLEDYGSQLPAQAREDLERVQHSGQDMQQLIEHLLLFSRSSRQPITKMSLDMAALVRETYNELMATQGGRLVEFTVGDLPPCLADRALLKQVFRNLLGNALKFTSKKEKSVVGVNCVHCDSEVVYSVRDNGAGFEMKHAGKLFGAFQRLHQASDFQGTGLGLSIVQRIVERHGGRVWAEGKIDEGATFYFTLPRG